MPGGKGAKGNTRPTKVEQPKKKDNGNTKDVYISVLFSAISFETMTTYRYREQDFYGKKVASVWSAYCNKPKWETGSFNKDQIDKAIFIDCTDLIVDLETERLDDPDGMVDLLERALRESDSVISSNLAHNIKTNVHFIITADDMVEDLAYAMNYICTDTMGEKIQTDELLDMVKKNFPKYFQRHKSKGWSIKVDYMGITEITFLYEPTMPLK